MARDKDTAYWQVCMNCDRRMFHAEPQVCGCGQKMIDALDHPDNAHRKQPAPPLQKAKPAGIPS